MNHHGTSHGRTNEAYDDKLDINFSLRVAVPCVHVLRPCEHVLVLLQHATFRSPDIMCQASPDRLETLHRTTI